jgi:HEAT repeat protein
VEDRHAITHWLAADGTGTIVKGIGLILALGIVGGAQDRTQPSPSDVPRLLKQLEEKDSRVVGDAASQLTKIGPPVGPALVDALRDRKGCQLQWTASGILHRLKLEPRLVDVTLLDIARGKCKGGSREDRQIKRQAAFVLVGRVEGIPAIAELLTARDVFVRQTAAFAFDDLTERLEGRPPRVEATTDIMSATTKAFPLLLGAALKDKDEVVRCMSYESLDQARRSTHEPLRSEATRLLEGKTIPCSR